MSYFGRIECIFLLVLLALLLETSEATTTMPPGFLSVNLEEIISYKHLNGLTHSHILSHDENVRKRRKKLLDEKDQEKEESEELHVFCTNKQDPTLPLYRKQEKLQNLLKKDVQILSIGQEVACYTATTTMSESQSHSSTLSSDEYDFKFQSILPSEIKVHSGLIDFLLRENLSLMNDKAIQLVIQFYKNTAMTEEAAIQSYYSDLSSAWDLSSSTRRVNFGDIAENHSWRQVRATHSPSSCSEMPPLPSLDDRKRLEYGRKTLRIGLSEIFDSSTPIDCLTRLIEVLADNVHIGQYIDNNSSFYYLPLDRLLHSLFFLLIGNK